MKREKDEKARGTREARDAERERDVHAEVHERDTWLQRERATHGSERERARTRVRRGGVCLLYRGTRMIWKGRGSRVTSCHSVVPSTYPPPVYEMSADRWGSETKQKKRQQSRKRQEEEGTRN